MKTHMSVLLGIQKMFPPPQIMSFPCVGVDVSDTSLKYIEFKRGTSESLEVKQWGDIDIPAGIVERGNVHDVTKLSAILSELKQKTKAQYVRMSLPEERAYLFETTIDEHVPAKEIRGLLDFRLEENVPLSPRDAYFDYAVVGRDAETGDRRVVVAVYAQSTINSYYEACTNAGVVPLSFEIEAQAIARATVPKTHGGTYLIVDFGKTRMGVGIVFNGILMYTSTMEIAGSQISEEMRKVLGNVSESELTTIKNTKGLAGTKDNEKIAAILKKYAENIADELSIRVHYWHSRGIDKEERTVKKVIVCGGSANMFGLPEFLSTKLEIPTERAHVWANAFSLEEHVPDISRRYSYGYATAVGLALKSFM
jgi:type IV pilus assembly protein PilM